MATQGRRPDPPVESLLFEEAHRFEFFQAVRLLERLYPHRQPVGQDAGPSVEVARFRAHVSLSFPASAIQKISAAEDGERPVAMTVAFMGLTGPLGVLPRHYTELLLDRGRRRDRTLRDFLDLFNHRLIAFFYRAWEKHHFPMAYERAEAKGGGYDHFSQGLLGLVGMATGGLTDRLQVEPKALMFFGGHLARHCRSASALEGLLEDFFGVPVRVIQFTGGWLPIPEHDRTCLDRKNTNNILGMTTVVGSRVWDPHAKFTVEVGPMGSREFHAFLPAGVAFQSLSQLTCLFAGEELDFDVRLTCEAAEVPECRLVGPGGEGTQLGWSTWLKTKPFTRDASDAVFSGRRSVKGRLDSAQCINSPN